MQSIRFLVLGHIKCFSRCFILLYSTLYATTSLAQSNTGDVLASWVALDAPTGHEHWATDSLQANYSGWKKDRYGNLIKSVGEGSPHGESDHRRWLSAGASHRHWL